MLFIDLEITITKLSRNSSLIYFVQFEIIYKEGLDRSLSKLEKFANSEPKEIITKFSFVIFLFRAYLMN